jgi:hypothetical protein
MDGGGGDLRSTIKKWNVIYPVYLNSKKTVAEGRRITAVKACPDPTCIEIADCCSHLKIPHAIEVSASSFSDTCYILFSSKIVYLLLALLCTTDGHSRVD